MSGTAADFFRAGRLFLEALRLDLEPFDGVRRRVYAGLALDVGGFLFFGARADVAGRLAEEIVAGADRPVWLAADLERGAGQHFRGLTTFPPPAALGSHPDPVAAARTAARRTAIEARGLGLNLALAPVLDLDVEPRNPIVGTRSFGADPGLVARLGAAWIETCQAEGVAACAKHFPGHGRTTADSHAELPVVDADRAALEADLTPFRAVASEVACVMTAHVAYPALGATGPATLDPAILTGLLREELGFDGLILTDALNMSGAREDGAEFPGDSPEVGAVRAGCDLHLYPPDLVTAARAVEHAATAEPDVAGRVEHALERGARLLERFPVGPGPAAPDSAGDALEADLLAAASVVPLGGQPPAWLDPAHPVTVTTIWDDREETDRTPFGELFRAGLREAGWTVARPGPAPDAGRIVLVASTPQAWKGTASLTPTGQAALDGALDRERAYPILFGHPRLLAAAGRPALCAWATEPAMEIAAARKLDQLVRFRTASP